MYFNEPPPGSRQIPVHPKVVGQSVGGGLRVFVDAKARPFARLADDALLDSADICRVFGCSARSLYRWVSLGLLKPAGKYGREFLFTKRETLRWWAERPHSGRPLSGRE